MNNEMPLSDKEPPKKQGVLSPLLFGMLLALLMFALPGIFLVNRGKFDFLLDKFFMPSYPPEGESVAPAIVDQPTADFYLGYANDLTKAGEYQKAIAYLDRVIEFDPKNDSAYAVRAKCYYRLTINEHVLQTHNANLHKALKDIDMAVALQPLEAEHYSIRRDVLANLAANLPYQVDRLYFMNALLDNDRAFLSLSTSTARREYVSAFMAYDLVDAGQCKEGMQLFNELEKKVDVSDEDTYGCLMCAAAAGYACLGDMDKAAESMEKALASGKLPKSRTYFMALYLYQAGKKDEALAALDASITADPTFIGNRYLLRSLIYLDMGKQEQAIQDLQMGTNYSWERADLYAYVNGKLALANGDQQEAIRWFQIAESSFHPYSNGLKQEALAELLQLGAQPAEMPLSVDIELTPMPSVTPIP